MRAGVYSGFSLRNPQREKTTAGAAETERVSFRQESACRSSTAPRAVFPRHTRGSCVPTELQVWLCVRTAQRRFLFTEDVSHLEVILLSSFCTSPLPSFLTIQRGLVFFCKNAEFQRLRSSSLSDLLPRCVHAALRLLRGLVSMTRRC